MRKLAPILPGVGALGILAAVAVAGGSNVPSSVSIDTGGTLATTTSPAPPPSRNFFLGGHVDSPKAKCLPNRTVKIRGFYETETGSRPFDTARTGSHGGYDGIGPWKHDGNEIEAATAKLKPKKVGKNICSGDLAGIG